MKRIFVILTIILLPLVNQAAVFNEQDISEIKRNFLANLLENGAVIASPSKTHPDYYYHWVRDAAIAMSLVSQWYKEEPSAEMKERLYRYVKWIEAIQHQSSPNIGQDILGEPKFYVNGQPFNGPWGRPQNDGAALRILALTDFANVLMEEQEDNYVQQHLYHTSLNPENMGIIKMDLEYISHHWMDKNYDLWEEVYGDHFFTAMVQRKALLSGAQLAKRLKDNLAANFYEGEARKIESRLKQHLDLKHGIIKATLAPHSGPQKLLELDSAIILASLLGDHDDIFFQVDNQFIYNTALKLKDYFKEHFPINKQHSNAVLFGRYPGDTYDGYQTNSTGNPWFILTATMSEYYYKLAKLNRAKGIKNYKENLKLGDAYLTLIKQYAPKLSMREQINLVSGEQQGALSLTWSYVAVLRAIDASKKVCVESANS